MTAADDAAPVVDIDHNAPEFLEHRFEEYARLRRECPVAYNTAYGGFWLVTGYQGVQAVARDNETFAHRFEPETIDGIDYQGIVGIPRASAMTKVGIAETDGPEHRDLRRALNPAFSPQAVAGMVPLMEATSTWFLDSVIERGSMDLVLDYATPVPAVLTLEMMGLPSRHWEHYAEFFHATASHRAGSAEYRAALGRAPEMIAELLEHAHARRRSPTDDLTSFLVQLELSGQPLADEEIGNIMFNLVGGGLDTTTSLTSWGLHHLGTHPEQRRRLIDDPALLPSAIEEFLRYFSVNESLTRTATRDVELCGRHIGRGDRVLISWVSANHDPATFASADDIVLDRRDNRHLAFGLGEHRCIGSHFARTLAQVMVGDVLRRVPDYVVDPERFRPYPANPVMTGVATMPVTFTPGHRVGPPEPPF